jgi:hypothetical protein
MKRQALLLLSLGLLFLIQTRGISWSQTTERVSVDTAFGNSDGGSNASSISSDGNYVAFQSEATDLVPAGSNGLIQIFVHDRQTGTTAQVSVDSNGDEGDFPSSDPAISSDGRYVVFMSDATNLLGVGNDTNGWSDIFVRDRDADDDGIYDEAGGVSTVRVSVYSDGAESNDPSTFPAISGSGRYVAFGSGGELDLTATELLLLFDVFVHDRDTDGDGIYDETGAVSTVRVSEDSNRNEANAASNYPSISADGRHVAFESSATNLVPGGSNGLMHIFVHDRDVDGDGIYDEPGEVSTAQVSVDSAGNEGDAARGASSISAYGISVAFESDATNLVTDDGNGFSDIFVYEGDPLPANTPQSEEKNNSGSGSCFISASASGWADF